jgi:uncharacterized protein YegP (UPF0339 family)/Zn-dependent protease
MSKATFELYEDSGGEYRWRLRHDNGNIIADSGEGYASKSGARDAIERMQEYGPDADVLDVGQAAFELYEDASEEWRWRLRHRNGNIIADSGEGYSSRSAAEDAVNSVKRNAPGAEESGCYPRVVRPLTAYRSFLTRASITHHMRNFHVGTITDIPIRLNVTLLVFLPVLAWLISRPGQLAIYAGFVERISPHTFDLATLQAGNTPILIGITAALGLFVGVLLHELGHAWTARRYDITITSITLWIFGGMAHMQDLPEDWNVEFYVALAGPAMSILVGAVCYALLFVLPTVPVLVFVVGWLAVINVTLAVFNMLPAFPMDGGRVLRALLARSRPYAEATQIAATIGKGMAILLAIFAVLAFAPLMLLIAMFVYIAASSESRTTVLRELLRGMTARELMSTDVRTVTPEATVDEFLERVMTERTMAYPVMDKGTVTGLVTLDAVRNVPEAKRSSTTVADVMGPAPPTVGPDDTAFEALQALSSSKGDRVLVTEEGRFVGQITNADLVTAIEVLQGLGPRQKMEVPDGYA